MTQPKPKPSAEKGLPDTTPAVPPQAPVTPETKEVRPGRALDSLASPTSTPVPSSDFKPIPDPMTPISDRTKTPHGALLQALGTPGMKDSALGQEIVQTLKQVNEGLTNPFVVMDADPSYKPLLEQAIKSPGIAGTPMAEDLQRTLDAYWVRGSFIGHLAHPYRFPHATEFGQLFIDVRPTTPGEPAETIGGSPQISTRLSAPHGASATVTPAPEVIEWVMDFMAPNPRETIYFSLGHHGNGLSTISAHHNVIVGHHNLAMVDTASLPGGLRPAVVWEAGAFDFSREDEGTCVRFHDGGADPSPRLVREGKLVVATEFEVLHVQAYRASHLAEESTRTVKALEAESTSPSLALAAAHLHAMDAHRLATYHHEEVRQAAEAQALPEFASRHQEAAERHGVAQAHHEKAWSPLFYNTPTVEATTTRAIAKAYYASAWADAMEEAGYQFAPQTRINREAPDPSQESLARAIRDAQALCEMNGVSTLEELLQKAADADRKGNDPSEIAEDFGFDIGMEMLGSGVSWKDDHEDFGYQAPHTEFHLNPEDAILAWARPETDEPFCGFITDDLFIARNEHEERGGFLLKVRHDRFVVCDEAVAMKAWGRTQEDMDRLNASEDFSEVGPAPLVMPTDRSRHLAALLKLADFKIRMEPEDTPVEGNALASGDDEEDRKAEETILEQLNNGNDWAWCRVQVVAAFAGLEGESTWLGCCSYQSEEDFKGEKFLVKDPGEADFHEGGGYYDDLLKEAAEDLLVKVEGTAGSLADLEREAASARWWQEATEAWRGAFGRARNHGLVPADAGDFKSVRTEEDRMGNVAIVVTTTTGRRFSPYFSQGDDAAMDRSAIEQEEGAWLNGMAGAANWDRDTTWSVE